MESFEVNEGRRARAAGMRKQNTNSSFHCLLLSVGAADCSRRDSRGEQDTLVFFCAAAEGKNKKHTHTVGLNLPWTRALPGSRSSLLCGKNTEGKSPYYSQTVALLGCYCHNQHGIRVGITPSFTLFSVQYFSSIIEFLQNLLNSVCPSIYCQIPSSLYCFQAGQPHASLVPCYMSPQPTIKSCLESLFLQVKLH